MLFLQKFPKLSSLSSIWICTFFQHNKQLFIFLICYLWILLMVWFFSECFWGGYGFSYTCLLLSLPWWLSGKESACNAGDLGSVSGLKRSLGEENGNTLQYSCLEMPWTKEPGGYSPWGCKSRTRLSRQTTNQHHHYC